MQLGRMKIDIPESWEDRSTYTFIAPRSKTNVGPVAHDDGFRTNVVVTVGTAGEARTLDEMAGGAKELIRSNFGEVSIEETAGPPIAGQPSRRLQYRIIEPGGALPIVQIQFLTIIERTERELTFTTAAVHIKAVMPEI